MSDARVVAVILLGWFCLAFLAGLVGLFHYASAPAVAITVWTLTGIVLLACWKVRSVRDWITIVDLRWLIALHLTRFVGVYFLVLARHGELPSAFATPAGYGDIFVAEIALLLLILSRDNTIRRHRAARHLYRKGLMIWTPGHFVCRLYRLADRPQKLGSNETAARASAQPFADLFCAAHYCLPRFDLCSICHSWQDHISMKRVIGIGGIFFKANDPEQLAAWYKKHLGLNVEEWGGVRFEEGADADLQPKRQSHIVWSPFEAKTDYFAPSEKPFMINYRVHDLDALLAQLRSEGVEIDPKTEKSEFGYFAWIMDPEGNRIELWEPPVK